MSLLCAVCVPRVYLRSQPHKAGCGGGGGGDKD